MRYRGAMVAVASLLLAPAAQADVIGFGAGAALWQHTTSGTVRYQSDDDIDVRRSDNGLGLERERDAMVWAHLEHPVPVLPNIKLMHTRTTTEGRGNINQSFGAFNFNEDVDSRLQLRQLDAVLYWELLDNWVELDLGLQVKGLDGEAEVRSRTDPDRREHVSFSGALPMGYARVAFHVPGTGLALEAAGGAIGYDGHRVTDWQAQLSYRTAIGLGAVLGWREQRLKLDDLDDVTADIRIDGPYAGVFYRF